MTGPSHFGSNSLQITHGTSGALLTCIMTEILSIQAACIHCGTLFSSSTSQQFCCAGCKFVYGLIQTKGLTYYYKLKEENPPTCPVPASSSNLNYNYCDDPVFLKKLSPDGVRLRFYIEGLNCTACLWLLEKLPTFCSDAESARIDMSSSTIEVIRKTQGSFAEIARTLNRFGYRPHPLSETDTAAKLQAKERRQDLVRIGIAGGLTGNIMILAVSLYGGAIGELAIQFRLLSATLAAPVLTYCAWPFYRSAFNAIKVKHLNLDVPIVLAILAGIVMSLWNLMASNERVYFDSISMLIFLLLSSRLILRTIQNKQMRSTHLENEMLLSSVERLTPDDSCETVSSLSLSVDDQIKIAADQSVPVDGFVVEGEGNISTAVLTGESRPLKIHKGDYVEAGSQLLSGNLILKVKNRPEQTRLARILQDTEKSSQEKSNYVRSADRVAGWFMALVILSAIAVVGFFWSTDLEEGISRALALLIVTCPCVFGIAIPLSMSMAIRNAAKKGIIVKEGDSIERLWSTKTLVFDKTGTLTTGSMEVLKVEQCEDSDFSYAFGLEQNQTHPVANALCNYLRSKNTEPEFFDKVQKISTGGVSGQKNGHTFQVKPIPCSSRKDIEGLIQSDIGFFKDDELLAKFELGDQLRQESRSLMTWVRSQKFKVSMVSGDRNTVVQDCAKMIGIKKNEIHSEIIPEAKAEIVRSFGKGTVMIGDGVNDAMALASAQVGIAVCGSLEVSLRAADIYLTRNSLLLIPQLFNIARLTKKAISRNLFFSASFNLISGTLAIVGLMTPLWAAVLMPLSSITILLSVVWTGKQIEKSSVSL